MSIEDAVTNGNIKLAREILEKDRSKANVHINDYESVLMKAVQNKDLNMIKLLVSYNADINHKIKYLLYTPLIWACMVQDEPIIDYLLSIKECNVNSVGKDGITALMALFVFMPKYSTVSALINRGADISVLDDSGQNIVYHACRHNDIKILKLLLSKENINLNSVSVNNMSVLMYLVYSVYGTYIVPDFDDYSQFIDFLTTALNSTFKDDKYMELVLTVIMSTQRILREKSILLKEKSVKVDYTKKKDRLNFLLETIELLVSDRRTDLNVKNSENLTFYDFVDRIKGKIDDKLFAQLKIRVNRGLINRNPLLTICTKYVKGNREKFEQDSLDSLCKDIKKLIS